MTAAPPLAASAAKLDAGSPAPRDATPRLREAPGDRLLVAGGLSGERSGRRGSFFFPAVLELLQCPGRASVSVQTLDLGLFFF